MTVDETSGSFDVLHKKVGRFDVSGRRLLVPEMNPFASRLLVASFRAFGVRAEVMETYTGLVWGKEFTSGKECFPCQITLGDILEHLHQEKRRLGEAFSADHYVYFLPEADGPCRFGMYNKLQRLVLDRFEEFRDIPIAYMSTQDSYAVAGLLPAKKARYFRRLAYVASIIADVLERVVWRVRPYELRTGMTDAFMEQALTAMAALIERVGAERQFHRLFALLEDIAATASSFIDRQQSRRPRIGIVGEIYLRCHPYANQQIIREVERLGAEVVNASLGEWINYISYERARNLRRDIRHCVRKREFRSLPGLLNQWLTQEIEKLCQSWRQQQTYRRAWHHLDVQPDHRIATIEKWLDNNHLFHFDIGTEAALSIGGALEYAHDGFDGVVNVYPFTCMPSTICSAILKPLLHQMRIPYLDASFDGTTQPNHEAVLRTFMYQAQQHQVQKGNGRTSL
ncbi:MAG TPA: CoA activase [Syntrophobacteraceae bacterium]|nr:CoA activase [Syntrophobacteraceae bacterium]